MKKILFITVIAIIALCSCSKNEPIKIEKSDAMTFGVYVGLQNTDTKASVADLVNLKSTAFGILAYYTAGDDMADAAATTSPDFMYNEEITWVADPGEWQYLNTKYWPALSTDKISFFAYSPYDGTCPITAQVGYPVLDYTVNNNNALQVDLLVSSTVNQAKGEGEIPTVELVFNHALSRIGFAAKNTTSGSTDVITVTSLKVDLTGVESKAKFTYADDFTNSSWAITADNKHTTTVDEVMDASINLDKVSFKDLNDVTKYLMLLPQTLISGDVSIAITFNITTSAGAVLTGYSASADLPAQTWEKGKRYTYNLNFDLDNMLDPITFDVTSVTDWAPGTTPSETNM